VACGLTCREASARPGMPSPPMVYRWLRNHSEFRALYVGALQFREEMLCDQVLALAERATPARVGAIRRRIAQLNRKIAACRAKVWTEAG